MLQDEPTAVERPDAEPGREPLPPIDLRASVVRLALALVFGYGTQVGWSWLRSPRVPTGEPRIEWSILRTELARGGRRVVLGIENVGDGIAQNVSIGADVPVLLRDISTNDPEVPIDRLQDISERVVGRDGTTAMLRDLWPGRAIEVWILIADPDGSGADDRFEVELWPQRPVSPTSPWAPDSRAWLQIALCPALVVVIEIALVRRKHLISAGYA